ncbi:MAG TPA: GNAT family protein [Candidatus Angelobacter sp.]|nr:GNAT family protein [Candidatus Angelobacter sp.]
MEFSVDDLVLRRPVDEDAADALAICTDPDVALWNAVPDVVDLESARDWCRRRADWSDGRHASWHAADAVTGRLLATCSLYGIDQAERTARIGYVVAPWARGRGVARVVVDAVTRWAFTDLGLVRVSLEHAVANEASCHVALAAGYRLEGVLRSSYVDGNGLRHDDHVHGRLVTDPYPDLGHHPVVL